MNYVFKSKSTGNLKKLVHIGNPRSEDQSDCYMVDMTPHGLELEKTQFSCPEEFEEMYRDLSIDPDWKLDSTAP